MYTRRVHLRDNIVFHFHLSTLTVGLLILSGQVKNIAMDILDFYDSHRHIPPDDKGTAVMNKLGR